MTKIIAIHGGGDWADASASYAVNISEKTGAQIFDLYNYAGGFDKTRQWFCEWAINNGYFRAAEEEDIEIIEED